VLSVIVQAALTQLLLQPMLALCVKFYIGLQPGTMHLHNKSSAGCNSILATHGQCGCPTQMQNLHVQVATCQLAHSQRHSINVACSRYSNCTQVLYVYWQKHSSCRCPHNHYFTNRTFVTISATHKRNEVWLQHCIIGLHVLVMDCLFCC